MIARPGSATTAGPYRDLALPGAVVVNRLSAKGFDTVVIADAECDSAIGPTAAPLRRACYVMITRASAAGAGLAGQQVAAAPGRAGRVGADAVTVWLGLRG